MTHRAKLPAVYAALHRTYPRALPQRITARTRVRLLGGSFVTLGAYARLYWYFDVSPRYTGVHGRIDR